MISTSVQPQTTAKWTVLLYSAADNNLTSAMVDDVKEIETVGSDSYTHIAAQVDQGGDIGAARYRLEKSSDPSQISSPVLEDMGQVNMSDPGTLADFIKWGVKTYPAEHYMVIISDHGNGWNGAVEDDSHGGWMKPGDIRQAFEVAQADTGKKIDILGMDACLMANAEFAHEMKDSVDYLVASEQTEGADGWNYSQILNPQLLQNLQARQLMKVDVTPRELAVLGVSSAQAAQDHLPTMTAIDMAKIPAVTQSVGELGQAIVASEASTETYQNIASATENFWGYSDMGDFASRLVASPDIDAGVKDAAARVNAARADAVIAEQHSDQYPGANGLTMEINFWNDVSEDYNALKFDQESHWSQAMAKVANGGEAGTQAA